MIKIFIISLVQDTDRQEFMKSQFSQYNVPFEFFNAVDGRILNDTEKEKLYDDKKYKIINKTTAPMLPGLLGCSLSHKEIYKKMIESNIERALIIEDDARLKPDFFNLLNYFNELPINNYAIKLEKCVSWVSDNNKKNARFTPWHRIKLTDDYFIGQPLTDPSLTWGYYIDIKAAESLCNIMPKIFLAPDAWWYFRKYIKLRMINKAIIGTNREDFSSTIWEGHEDIPLTTSEKIRKVIKKIGKVFYFFINIFR